MLLIDKINEKIKPLNFKLTLDSAVYNKTEKKLYLQFLYSNELMLSSIVKTAVQEVVYTEFKGADIDIKYKKNYFDSGIIKAFILECMRKEYPFVGIRDDCVDYKKINNENLVSVLIDNSYKDFTQNKPIDNYLQNCLTTEYKEDFNVKIEYGDNVAPKIIEERNDNFDFGSVSQDNYEIELESIEPYIGELVDAPIYPIASFIEPVEGISVCGKIENLKGNKTKNKVDDKGVEKEGREYFSFDLADYSGRMHVVYFPGKANMDKFKKLTDGSEIVVFGNLEDDKFSAGMTLRPKVINLCITKKGFYDIVYSLPVPKRYSKVYPEAYVSTQQENLFVESSDIKNNYLLENDFVVFDLETTGVNYMTDKIIEIGAVKIVQGKLTETFGTLINPERHIPADATKVNNITDDDVKDAPTLKEVMPDFFKFCDGCILVSYVIDFDFGFIEYHGKSLGYAFQNKTDDCFVMAKNKLKGLKNYKLTTVAKHLDVPLENAHRAVFDAVAAGEVMIKLLEKF